MYKERTVKEILADIAQDVQDGDTIRIISGEVIVNNSLGTEIYREYYR